MTQDEIDAKRYRFLKQLKGISLSSSYMQWTREDGSKFTSNYYFAGNDTQYEARETLDETIDEAMRVELTR